MTDQEQDPTGEELVEVALDEAGNAASFSFASIGVLLSASREEFATDIPQAAAIAIDALGALEMRVRELVASVAALGFEEAVEVPVDEEDLSGVATARLVALVDEATGADHGKDWSIVRLYRDRQRACLVVNLIVADSDAEDDVLQLHTTDVDEDNQGPDFDAVAVLAATIADTVIQYRSDEKKGEEE